MEKHLDTEAASGSFMTRLKTDKKMQMWAAVVIVVVLLVVLGGIFYKGSNDSRGEKNEQEQAVEEAPTTIARKIDGVQVEPGVANVFPTAIMIENLVQVRPQSGLGKANVVYEALAEGGITRFMAVFANDSFMEKVGPVRSARDYYVDFAEEYGAIYAHAGGSPEALGKLQSSKEVLDANALTGGVQQFFQRDTKTAAPHNLFTNSGLISELMKNKGVNESEGKYEAWKFADDSTEATATTADATSIHLDFSSSDYKVSYDYDAADKVFNRLNGGKPHADALTDKQITVKTVVVQKTAVVASGDDKGRVDVRTTGEGDALVFVNGGVIEGSWKYDNGDTRTRFYDAAGDEIVFEPGNIWVEVIPDDRAVEYTAQSAQ